MERNEKNSRTYYVVDFVHLVKAIWHRVWIVVLVSILAAAIGFSYATFMIEPTYSSSVMLYVNNGAFNVGDIGFSISSSEITAAQSLTKTYIIMLQNRTTLERLIEETGVDYSWKEINSMISAGSVNDTEVLRITVTCNDPFEAELLANGIAKVLPQRISEVIEGASMEVVDSAVAVNQKVAPNITEYTAGGFILGALLSLAVLALFALLDNTIHDEDYIIDTYDYPVLAKVPDLLDESDRKYSYYYKHYKKSSTK